jgi:Uma2 family endonuclease
MYNEVSQGPQVPLEVERLRPHPLSMSDEKGRPPRRRATYEDLESIPPTQVGEIVEGLLYVSPRPRSRHAVSAGRLYRELSNAFERGWEGPGGWWLLFEPELHLGGDALVPDVAGWRRERLPEVPDVAAFTLAPDWVCEVLSPASAVLDREKKMGAYAREGVGHLWLVDPSARTLETYRLHEGRWRYQGLHTGDAIVRAEPFEDFALPLSMLWLR